MTDNEARDIVRLIGSVNENVRVLTQAVLNHTNTLEVMQRTLTDQQEHIKHLWAAIDRQININDRLPTMKAGG